MSSLLRVLGQLFLFAVLVIAAAAVLRHMAAAAFRPGGSSPRAARGRGGRALRSPAPSAVRAAGRSAVAAAAHPGNSQIRTQARADARRAWTEVKAADWLEQRRHERQHGPAGGTATAAAPKTLRQRLRLAPFTPASPGGADAGGGSAPAPAPPAANGRQGPAPPPRAPAPPAPPASTNGGTTVAAPGTAGAEQLIEGVNRIHAEAAAGGIHHKQAAVKAATEGCIRFAGMAQMLARTMSEPGNNYGPEITEPLGKAAQHLQAAAMSFGESDTNITTLIHMSVGELASSPRSAPDRSELSEAGAR